MITKGVCEMDPILVEKLDRLDSMLVQLLRTSATKATVAELRKDNEEIRKDVGSLIVEITWSGICSDIHVISLSAYGWASTHHL
jgi:hypothetical protein